MRNMDTMFELATAQRCGWVANVLSGIPSVSAGYPCVYGEEHFPLYCANSLENLSITADRNPYSIPKPVHKEDPI